MVGHVEIGIRYYGKTAAIGKEAVYTSFFVFCVPTLPTGCYYGVRSGNRCETFRGRSINWHFRSVLLGYLRWVAIVPPILAFIRAVPNDTHFDWNIPLFLLAIALAGIYVALFFLFVNASPRETRQRKLLAQIVRTTVDPAWIPRAECEEVVNNLRPVLESLNVSLDPRAWQLRKPDSEIAPFMYTYARYMHGAEPDNDWDDAADRVWLEMESDAQNAKTTLSGRLVCVVLRTARFFAPLRPPAAVGFRDGPIPGLMSWEMTRMSASYLRCRHCRGLTSRSNRTAGIAGKYKAEWRASRRLAEGFPGPRDLPRHSDRRVRTASARSAQRLHAARSAAPRSPLLLSPLRSRRRALRSRRNALDDQRRHVGLPLHYLRRARIQLR